LSRRDEGWPVPRAACSIELFGTKVLPRMHEL